MNRIQRNYEMLKERVSGKSFADIGKKYNLSAEYAKDQVTSMLRYLKLFADKLSERREYVDYAHSEKKRIKKEIASIRKTMNRKIKEVKDQMERVITVFN